MNNSLLTKLACILIVFLLCASPQILYCHKVSFRIHLDTNKYIKDNLSGRIFVMLNSDTNQLALYWPNLSNPQPAFATDVMNLKPGDELIFDENADSWMHTLNDLEGSYSVSALFDIDTKLSSLLAPGNLVSEKTIINIKKDEDQIFDLTIKYPIQPFPFNETDFIKEIKIKSQLLSDFYKIPTFITGAVILPKSYYENSEKSYPVVYVFPGWGGNRFHIVMGDFQQKRYGMNNNFGEEKIFIFMDQECRYGYHVFANSENNGPRADAFVQEFIPAIEEKYRIAKQLQKRFLIGQSSGAWAALWLQLNYPDLFGGAWAASPDPVDFRYFESYGNIYDSSTNIYYDSKGNQKNHVRTNGKAILSNYDYILMERVYGEGYQMGSYESVFSKKGGNGKPSQLFDRKTGMINIQVSENWKKYDIRHLIENAPKDFLEKISGKIHIYVSNDDDYYLDLAVKGLKEITDKLDFDIEFEFFDGLGHSIWSDSLRRKIHQQMDNISNNKQ